MNALDDIPAMTGPGTTRVGRSLLSDAELRLAETVTTEEFIGRYQAWKLAEAPSELPSVRE